MRAATAPYVRGVGIEDSLIVSLAVFGEALDDVGVGLVAIGLERVDDHPEAAIRHDGALERRLGLKTDDDFVLLVDIARIMRGDRTWNLRDVENSLFSFFQKEFIQLVPQRFGAFCGSREERLVSFVRCVVLLDEVADVDLASARDPL